MPDWLRILQGRQSLSERRQTFFQAARVFLVIFMVGSVLAAARFAWALYTGQEWLNYRGDQVTHAGLIRGLIASGVAALLSAVALAAIVRSALGPRKTG